MAPITLSGFNNIDFKSIIDIIMKSERQPIDRIQARQAAEQTRLNAYGNLNSTLSSLQSAFTALKSSTAYGDLKADSSDSSVLTATSTSAATKGTFSIDVTSLARPQVTASAAGHFDDIDADIIDGGTFSLTQAGTTTSIDLTGVTTLTELRDAINAQQTGVKASIINDGSTSGSPPKPFRLILASVTPGTANAFTVDDQTTFAGGVAGAVLSLSTDGINGVAKDTEFTYNGISVKSASTTVSAAIPGLTVRLFKTGTASITVDDDDSTLKDKIQAAVTAFNTFDDFAKNQFKPPASGGTPAPLATDPLLRTVNRQLRSYITSSHANSGDIGNLAEIGITLGRNGKLSIDQAKLDAALSEDPDSVQAFFSGDTGFAAKVSSLVDSYTLAGGSIDIVESGIRTTMDAYSDRMISLESQLSLREETLTRQFAAADEAISQLNAQVNALSSLGSQYRLF